MPSNAKIKCFEKYGTGPKKCPRIIYDKIGRDKWGHTHVEGWTSTVKERGAWE